MVAPDNLMESPMDRNASKDNNSNETNGNETENVIKEVHKQPSYVSLACCISGYTTLSYGHKERRLRSRTVSPIRRQVQNASYTSEFGNFLTTVPKEMNSKMQTQGNGLDFLNGCGGLHSPKRVANIVHSQEKRTFNSSLVKDSYSTYNSMTSKYSSYTGKNFDEKNNGSRLITPTNINEQLPQTSFIMQRVERLYGPGALAQGFYTPRKANTIRESPSLKNTALPDANSEPEKNEASLPVLKLLRPEFRAQLEVTSRKSRGSTPDRYSSLDASMMDKSKKNDVVDATSLKDATPLISKTEVKDGFYYLKLHAEQVAILEALAENTEKDLETCENEEICGVLRAAAGKARLLVAQKLNQFKGLCKKNIEQLTSDDFPTTNEDLAGFWDMVMIQVNDILTQFENIAQLKKNNWKSIDVKETVKNIPQPRKVNKKPVAKETTSPSIKARDEARKKLIEERRRALKENKDNKNADIVLL